MRMQGILVVYLMFLRMMSQGTTSHVLPKASRHCHSHRPMANPCELYNDFAGLIEAGAPAPAPGAGGVGGAGGAGAGAGAGADETGKPAKCDSSAKCNVNEVIRPGDPKQKSSSIALKAAAEAKAANEAQSAAGQAAAQHIKLELAQKAFQSAKAAEAALMGKQMMVDQLEQEVHEASAVVEEETNGLHATEVNMNAAVEAARQATQQFEIITELQKTAKENLSNIQAVALGAQNELAVKTQLLEAARNRMALLHKQLLSAQDDYEKTKAAAYKAACAAVEAKQKAGSYASNTSST
ncbi:hypothetical protein KR009_009614, partial [Drosophila setifemur]